MCQVRRLTAGVLLLAACWSTAFAWNPHVDRVVLYYPPADDSGCKIYYTAKFLSHIREDLYLKIPSLWICDVYVSKNGRRNSYGI